MQTLDSLSFPLHGASLIEASAGTGKTYTIVNLYLRQLLGHECPALNVDQILVVTFTNAATAELKARIRQRLQHAYLDFYRGHSDDPFIQAVYQAIENKALATQRLALASKQMDEAAIFTIHGFCQRALSEHAFESGAMYEQAFILDESEWLKLSVDDYWRKHIVTQPAAIQAAVLNLWRAPEHLLATLQPLLNRKAKPHQSLAIGQAVATYQTYIASVGQIKQWWLDRDLKQQLLDTALKGNSVPGKPATLSNMQTFCQSDELHPQFHKEGWLIFSPTTLEKALKKGGHLPDEDFACFDEIAQQQQVALNAIKQAFSEDALQQVAANLVAHKRRMQLISPDDLLSQLSQALNNDEQNGELAIGHQQKELAKRLASALLTRYPTVLIDEFQDTDQIQYRIFSHIYALANDQALAQEQHKPCWIMIGDPKQAIYGFRGADIYTYLLAKQRVGKAHQFTLDTNWRSTPALVNAVNTLFEHNQQVPSQKEILAFQPVKAGKKVRGLTVNQLPCHSLDFWHLAAPNDKPIAKNYAQQALAQHCALQIKHILRNNSQVADRRVLAGDCSVLVRSRNEAQLIKNALHEQAIASVFLVRKSVFASQIALDCYRLLSALSHPGDDRQVKTALLCELFALDAKTIDELFNHDAQWQYTIALFHQWHQDWQKYGLMMALNKVICHFKLEQKNLQYFSDGLRRVTDLRHVLELLQQRSLQVQGHGQLMHWFSQCIQDPDHSSDSQQLRLETDANLVQISTLHAAKGLQYPLVFIPFANSYTSSREAIYHGESGDLLVDFLAQDKIMAQADNERLAEDVRLLYVALTRAEYYCAVGIWHNVKDDRSKRSAFTASALGALLLPSESEVNDQAIAQQIALLSPHADIGYTLVTQNSEVTDFAALPVIEVTELSTSETLKLNLEVLQLTKPIERQWRLTSYSALSQQQNHVEVIRPGLDEGPDRLIADADDSLNVAHEMNAFSFEKGANAGSFLHAVLEHIDFTQSDSLDEAIRQQSVQFAIDATWHESLKLWLTEVLNTPFEAQQHHKYLALNQLQAAHIKIEMEFYLPLKSVQVDDFNQLINHFMPQYVRHYDFAQLNGMLKGFIDLTFAFDGKYYVADYKSNHLGMNYTDYSVAQLERAMHEHDYHLQAILYTLALHRWLKQQLRGYQYSQHIGGAYYLFLRGMQRKQPANGVYFYLAEQAFIEALDALFNGSATAMMSDKKSAKSLEQPATSGQLNLW